MPTQTFKAIYDPKIKQAGAYLIDNAENAQPQQISIAELEKLAGISIFPSIKEDIKVKLMELPKPKSFKERKRKGD